VTITSPASFSRVFRNTPVTLRATATDNVGVAGVAFFVDGVGQCWDTVAPYTCNWVVPNRTGLLFWLIQAVAVDAAGNAGQTFTILISF
jgi:hypothetical protein